MFSSLYSLIIAWKLAYDEEVKLFLPRPAYRHREIPKTLSLTKVAIFLICLFLGAAVFRVLTVGARLPKGGKLNLILEEPLSIFSLDQNLQEAVVILVPEETVLELPLGLGSYKAGAVSQLSKQEKKDLSLLGHGVSLSLGVMTDGWLGSRESSILGFRIQGDRLEKVGFFQGLSAIFYGNSNLSFVSRFELFWSMVSAGSYNVKLVKLGELGGMDRVADPDGQVLIQPEATRLSTSLGVLLRDPKVSRSGITVTIVNSTGLVNLAREISRAMRNSGVRVIAELSRDGYGGYCRIVGDKKLATSFTVRKIEGWMGCIFTPGEVFGRSQLEVWFGDEFKNYLLGEKPAR